MKKDKGYGARERQMAMQNLLEKTFQITELASEVDVGSIFLFPDKHACHLS